jgi:hypothetical protein
MPDMVLNRNYDLSSLHGRTVNFKKGEPVWVPPQCVKEALQIGAEGVDEKLDILDGEKPAPPEYTQQERTDMMLEAFPELELANDRDSFTAQGIPTVTAIQALTGFAPTSKERDDAWVAYLQYKSDVAAGTA